MDKLFFGIYLIHYQILTWTMEYFAPTGAGFIFLSLLAYAASTLLAALTYCHIERPALNLRDKLLERGTLLHSKMPLI